MVCVAAACRGSAENRTRNNRSVHLLQLLTAGSGPTLSRRSSSTESAYCGEAENICSLRGVPGV